MCKCTPVNIRTRFCGKPGCTWPNGYEQLETANMREAVMDIYQESVYMGVGNEEFTHKYTQDCLKIKIVDKLFAEGYRKQQGLVEFCICAAVLTETGRVILGHRHDDCLRTIVKMNLKRLFSFVGQGFMTSFGRYVDREEGARIQNRAGILSCRTGQPIDGDLFSEDLY